MQKRGSDFYNSARKSIGFEKIKSTFPEKKKEIFTILLNQSTQPEPELQFIIFFAQNDKKVVLPIETVDEI